MSNYNTTKQKLRKLFNQQSTQLNDIDNQIVVNGTIINRVNKLNKQNNQLSNFVNLSSDWTYPSGVIYTNDIANTTKAEWEIFLTPVPEDFSFGLNYAILYRYGVEGEIINSLDAGVSLTSNVVQEIIDIENSDNKSLRINASVVLSTNDSEGVQGDINFKFVCYWVNPLFYYK